jgi:anti-repressor protein
MGGTTLTEGTDYVGCKTFNTQAHQELQDYQITIEMGKHIAMVQRNEAGMRMRNYFIELEKKWNSPEQVIARGLIESQKMLSNLALQIQEMKPKADYFDDLVDRNLLMNFRDTAKELKLGQKYLIEKMINDGYIYRDRKGKLKPYMKCVEKGLFELKELVNPYNGHADTQTLITPKGRETFRLLYKK